MAGFIMSRHHQWRANTFGHKSTENSHYIVPTTITRMPVLEKIDKEFSWSSKLHIVCKYWKFVRALFRTKYMLLLILGLKWSAFPHNEIVVFVIGVVQTVPKSVRFLNRNHLFVRGVTAF